MGVALLLDDVRKSLAQGFLPKKRPILRGVSFEVREGEIFGFLGPNGAGKTTTIKTILSLLRADGGKIEIFGSPHTQTAARARVGFMPENPYFYDYLTGREFVVFHGVLAGLSAAAGRQRADELLERLGLGHAAGLPLRKYSRGMLQRAGLAQALVGDPDLLILDEPMSGLDPFGRKEVRDLILEQRARGKTVFFSSHILADAELLCDRAAIIKDGRAHVIGVAEMATRAPGRGYEAACRGLSREALRGFNIMVEREGAFLVRLADEDEKNRLLALLAKASGASLESLVPHRPSLESLLLDFYGRSAPSGDGGPSS